MPNTSTGRKAAATPVPPVPVRVSRWATPGTPCQTANTSPGTSPGGATTPAKPSRPRRPYRGRRLTVAQKKTLSIKARQAYDFQDNLGLIDIEADTATARHKAWKAAQLMEAVGQTTLLDCTNSDFRPIENHFNALMGKVSKKKTGPVNRRGKKPDKSDTHESRQEVRALIIQALEDHARKVMHPVTAEDKRCSECALEKGGIITAKYVEALAAGKFRNKRLRDLTTHDLRQLHYTVVNRITAREGRGQTRNRNKSQRRKKE